MGVDGEDEEDEEVDAFLLDERLLSSYSQNKHDEHYHPTHKINMTCII